MTEFPTIHGHEAVKATLRQTTAHTLLFTGPESVGRRAVARWYAAWLNCERPGREPCGSCDSCRLTHSAHPDYREIGPEALTKSGRASRRQQIRIDELVLREGGNSEPLSRWLEIRPRFKRRVGVIDHAESLTEQAANAFLKMLEEPPSYALIILIAPSTQAVLPTITSRSLPVRFGAVPDPDAGLDPVARLGQPGRRAHTQEQPEAYEAVRESVKRYLLGLSKGLEEALEQADGLEKEWLKDSPFDLSLLLRAELSLWPPGAYAAAEHAVERCETALAAYASPSIAVQVLTLELREIRKGFKL